MKDLSKEELMKKINDLELIVADLKIKNKENEFEKDLRDKAKKIYSGKSVHSDASSVDTQKLIEELNIHQIELELQNEELKLANEKIQKEREQYISLFNDAPIPYLTLNKYGNIIYINQTAANLLNVDKNLLVFNSFFPFISEESKFSFNVNLQNVFEGDKSASFEISLKNNQLKEYNCYVYATLYFDNSYNEQLCRITLTDISSQKLYTDKLISDSENKFKTFFESINDAVFIHPLGKFPNEHFVEVNAVAIKKYGYSEEEFKKLSPIDITLEKSISKDEIDEVYSNIKNSGFTLFEVTHITKNGKEIPVEVSAKKFKMQDKEFVISIARDISDKLRSLNEIKKLNDRIESSMISGNMAWWELELPSGKTVSNENKVKLLGYDKKDFNHYMDFMKFIHPDDYESTMQAMRDLIAGKNEFYECEYRIKTIEDEYLWFYDIGKISSRIDDKIIITGVIIDITDKKENEINLKKLNESKDKLFSIIAHDLRSPFTGFLGLTELLASDNETISKEEVRKIAKSLNNSANSIYQLINDLLMWSTTQSGNIPFNPEEIDIYELLFNNVFLLEETAKKKNIKLINNSNPGMICKCDRTMIMTVVRNLVDNAIKFSDPDSEIIVNADEDFDSIKVSVTDFGKGIREDIKNNIFNVGQKVSLKGTAGEKGTGFGLIISKEFIEKNKGKIWLQSEINKGSTFYFTLPKK